MIYFVRHGETEWNLQGRYQGQMDSPLTSRGERAVALVGEMLSQELVGRAEPIKTYVSPLGRAQQTAAILAKNNKMIFIKEDRLREVSLGALDGSTREEIAAKRPGVLDSANMSEWCFRSLDGEILDAARSRVTSWLNEITGAVVAVSHGLIGRILIGVYIGLSGEEMLKIRIPQDAYYKLSNGSAEMIGGGLLNGDTV